MDNVEEEMEVGKESVSADVRGEENQLVRRGDKRKGRLSEKKKKLDTVLQLSFSEDLSSSDSQDGLEMDHAGPLFRLTEETDIKGHEERERESSGFRATHVSWAELEGCEWGLKSGWTRNGGDIRE